MTAMENGPAMTDTRPLLEKLYASFNARDIDACLAGMTEDVHWPKASEGGYVTGKEQVRAYWLRQWSEFDPRVDPVHITTGANSADVTVHQVVKRLNGDLLFDGTVLHRFTFADGLVSGMEVEETARSAGEASAFGVSGR